MLQDTAFSSIQITCMHCRLQWKAFIKEEILDSVPFPTSVNNQWLFFPDHMITGDFSLNFCSFQHKRQITLKEWADASFFLFSAEFDAWPQALFAAHYSNVILKTELLLSAWVFPMASIIIVSECFRKEQLTTLRFTSVHFLYSWATSELLSSV